jgi:hypothetical protein
VSVPLYVIMQNKSGRWAGWQREFGSERDVLPALK